MKKLFIISICFLLYACSLDFDTETRIAVKGKIIDENQKPIPNIDIHVKAYKDGFNGIFGCFECDIETIMKGRTIENGEFIIFSPIPSNVSEYNISINANNFWGDAINTNYKIKYISDIKQGDFINYTYNLGTVTLEFNN
jgi:hypothetical protein